MKSESSLAIARTAAIATVLTACSGGSIEPYDWRNRDLAWKYGPTKTAPRAHLLGTGAEGGQPMAEGWHCEIRGGDKLTIRPYKLAKQHQLFGEAGLAVGLFNRDSSMIKTLQTEAITETPATFSFDLDEPTAKQVFDVILYYQSL